MRTIKFRVWNGNKIYYLDDEYVSEGIYKSKTKDHKLMQYTGLKDKNGVEIYEGDIVEYHWFAFVNGSEVDKEDTGLVTYSPEFCMFLFEGKRGAMNVTDTDHYEGDGCIEVIGNIYEDKQLLK